MFLGFCRSTNNFPVKWLCFEFLTIYKKAMPPCPGWIIDNVLTVLTNYFIFSKRWTFIMECSQCCLILHVLFWKKHKYWSTNIKHRVGTIYLQILKQTCVLTKNDSAFWLQTKACVPKAKWHAHECENQSPPILNAKYCLFL